MKYVMGFIGVVVLLFGLSWVVEGNNFFLYKYWAPKQANVEREVFVNTNSYIQGKTEYLSRLRMEYQSTKDEDRKAALRSLIISEASTVDNSKLPIDMQGFISLLKGN